MGQVVAIARALLPPLRSKDAVPDLQTVEALRRAYGLRPTAAWLLGQLAAADGRIVPLTAVRDGRPWRAAVADIRPLRPDFTMIHIRDALGWDAIETVPDQGWKLTPLGKIRIRRALGREVLDAPEQ